MVLRLTLVFTLIACPLTLIAQSAMQSQPNIIDGAQHPELIPDSVAYRLYFIAVAESPNPTPDEIKRQNAYLGEIGLAQNDSRTLTAALANFKVQYAAIIADYNKTAEAETAEGIHPEIGEFLIKREALVESTREVLKSSMTPVGLAKLHNQIMREKRMMKVAAKEAQWAQQ